MSYFPPWDEPVTRLYDEDDYEQELLDMTPAERNLYDILHSHVETTVRYAPRKEPCGWCLNGEIVVPGSPPSIGLCGNCSGRGYIVTDDERNRAAA